MSNWYDRAFGPWYLKLYPHRNLEEAERALVRLEPQLPPGVRVLDVGCGPGRHLVALRARGRTAVGLDRSAPLLREAARTNAAPGRLVRGDMRRLPFREASFGAVLSMFTSFGYFATAAEHRALLAEYARVTAPGGVFVLDYLNAPAVKEFLVPESCREVDGYEVVETRSIRTENGGSRVVKKLTITDGGEREVERYEESVALYNREELRDMLDRAGWLPAEPMGGYDGRAWSHGAPRLIFVSRRKAQ